MSWCSMASLFIMTVSHAKTSEPNWRRNGRGGGQVIGTRCHQFSIVVVKSRSDLVITHGSGSRGIVRVASFVSDYLCGSVCASVRAVKRKWPSIQQHAVWFREYASSTSHGKIPGSWCHWPAESMSLMRVIGLTYILLPWCVTHTYTTVLLCAWILSTHTQPFYGTLGFFPGLPGWPGTRKVKPGR